MTLEITLTTPDGIRQTATCDGISSTKTKGGVIHDLARKLQEEGHDPETPVIVTRNGTPVFCARPLKAWADTMIYENDRQGGFRRVRWNYEAAAALAESRSDAA